MKSFQNWKISVKIVSISVFTILVILCGMLFYFIPLVESKLMDEKRTDTRHLIEVVDTLAASYGGMVKSGNMKPEQAQKAVIANIRSLRYQGSEYFAILSLDGKMIMHPIKPELEGKDVLGDKDTRGKFLFQEMVRVAKEKGAGFVDYYWPKPNETKPSPKLTYVKLLPQWGWILMTGIYVDDVNAELTQLRIRVIVATILIALLVLAIAYVVSRLITRPLAQAVSLSNRLAEGDLSTSVEAKSTDEAGLLLKAMNNMVEKLKAIVADEKMLFDAAVEGRLATRADASRHQGDFRNIVQGVNDMLDAVVGPLTAAAGYVDSISKGTIPAKITDDYRGDFNGIKENINTLIEKLSEVVESIKTAADNVAAGSEQMSTSSQQMSQGATEQAASAEEVSSSMEQMVSNIRQTADNAQQTEKIAVKAAQDAKTGGEAVVETVSAMKEIANRISIIEEIARQTNLLALNAAIEAARAGEHGKGFAVVATEVRKLAERSQLAAGEINRLSVSSVAVAERAGEMLARMVPDIQRTAELVSEINAASAEQNAGAEQINKAIQQLDLVIQQNASATEEMASTSEELASQAEQLMETLEFFRTEGSSGARARKTSPNRQPLPKSGHRRIPSRPSTHDGGNGQRQRGLTLDLSNHRDALDEEFEQI